MAKGGIKFKVSADLSGLHHKYSAGQIKAAQTLFATRVGFDSNKYCKVDTGQTQRSMQAASNFAAGEVSWDTDYAKAAYYNPSALHDKNPNASSKWFEVAKRNHQAAWLEYAKAQLAK